MTFAFHLVSVLFQRRSEKRIFPERTASYPLHGVSRHQDRKGIGNAFNKEHHREDMEFDP